MIINIVNAKTVISFETPVMPRPSLRNIRIACSIARNALQLQRLQRRVFAEACKIFEAVDTRDTRKERKAGFRKSTRRLMEIHQAGTGFYNVSYLLLVIKTKFVPRIILGIPRKL